MMLIGIPSAALAAQKQAPQQSGVSRPSADAGQTGSGESSVASASVLAAGESLYSAKGDRLTSPSMDYQVELDSEYVQVDQFADDQGGSVEGISWQSDDLQPVTPTRLTMQTDGNLVLYRVSDNRPLWYTRTNGSGSDDRLVMQDDGNLVVYTTTGHAVWWSGSGPVILPSGLSLAAGQGLINRDQSPEMLHFQPMRLTMQTDGNLVLYHGSQAVWSTRTSVPGSRAVMQTNGDFVVYTPTDKALWHTATYTNLGQAYVQLNYCLGPQVELVDPNHERDLWTLNYRLSC